MATDYGTGAARGIFPHKNLFGAAMALGLLAEWYVVEDRGLGRIMKFASLPVFAGLLVISRSMTSILTVGATIVIVWLFERFHRRYHIPLPAILLFLAGLLVCVALFGIDTSIFTEMMGRSRDLTGRTDLWRSVGSMILARPLLGYGFSGFWGGASMESFAVEKYVGWSPTYSHNGYLEILLNLGIVGTGLFLIFLWKGMTRVVHLAEVRDDKKDLWPLAFLIFFVVHNFAECTIIWQNCFEWSLSIATVISSDPMVQDMIEGAKGTSEAESEDSELPFAFDHNLSSPRDGAASLGDYASHR
jgi:O-antigen ligase